MKASLVPIADRSKAGQALIPLIQSRLAQRPEDVTRERLRLLILMILSERAEARHDRSVWYFAFHSSYGMP